MAILLALSHQRKAVELLETAIKNRVDPLAIIEQGLILPYATWLVFAAMIATAIGDFYETRSLIKLGPDPIHSPTISPKG